MFQIKTTLYALNKNGSYQQWKVFAKDNQVIVEFGKVDGKVQQKVTICESKNIGRANETTGEDQAIAEAISKWEKQVRLGYRETIEELTTVEQLSPMLAHDAIDHYTKIIYPCDVQPKLDGLRCLVTFDTKGNPTFNSRGNKTYPIVGKIVEQTQILHELTEFPMLDGEVYLHGLTLQKISSLAKKWRTHEDINKEIQKDFEGDNKRRDKAISNGEKTYKNFNKKDVSVELIPVLDVNRYGGYESADLQFHVFDIPSNGKQWSTDSEVESRKKDFIKAAMFATKNNLTHVEFVHSEVYYNEEQVKDSIAINMSNGYEGSIIRNFKGTYEFCYRSYDLLKWKTFKSAEALVLSSKEDKNGEGVLLCVNKEGAQFECKMKGTHNERSQEEMLKLVDKYITFTYQALTDDGIPQFPVGQYVRDVNPETWEVLE